VLAFLKLNTNTSLGLFWTLVQVLLHTNLIQLSTSSSSSSWVSVYVPSGKSTRIHAYALVYGEGGRITIKPTLVGHIHTDIIIFTQKLLGCVMISKTLVWWWLCAHLSNLGYLTSPNSKGVRLKIQKQNRHMISKFNTLVPISLINYLKQAFLP
jgi:hypothetical protein